VLAVLESQNLLFVAVLKFEQKLSGPMRASFRNHEKITKLIYQSVTNYIIFRVEYLDIRKRSRN